MGIEPMKNPEEISERQWTSSINVPWRRKSFLFLFHDVSSGGRAPNRVKILVIEDRSGKEKSEGWPTNKNVGEEPCVSETTKKPKSLFQFHVRLGKVR